MTWSWPLMSAKSVPTEGPASFGHVRKHHIHEGVDLHVNWPEGVFAVEPGHVVWKGWFTGPGAGSPWWLPTMAVMVKGESGIVVYGELDQHLLPDMNEDLDTGSYIGHIARVLRNDKGAPTHMLHLELRKPGYTELFDWKLGDPKPDWLLDPTPFLLRAKP